MRLSIIDMLLDDKRMMEVQSCQNKASEKRLNHIVITIINLATNEHIFPLTFVTNNYQPKGF